MFFSPPAPQSSLSSRWAIIAEIFPDTEKGRVLGIAAGANSFGHFVGPILGGYLIGAYGWRISFFMLAPCAVLAALMAARYLPALSPSGTSQRFDILGATLIGATMCTLSLGLSYGQLLGFAHIYVLLLFAASAICLAAFLYAERRVPHPVLDFELFRSRPFTLHIAIAALAGIATSGVTFLLPFFMQLALGLNILQVGYVMAIVSIEIALIAPVAGYLADRLGAHRVTLLGLATLLIGFLVASTVDLDNSQLGFLLRILPMGIGIGLFMSPNSTVILAAAPAARLGVASGLIGLTRMIGQTTGIALLGAVFASNVARLCRHRSRRDRRLTPGHQSGLSTAILHRSCCNRGHTALVAEVQNRTTCLISPGFSHIVLRQFRPKRAALARPGVAAKVCLDPKGEFRSDRPV